MKAVLLIPLLLLAAVSMERFDVPLGLDLYRPIPEDNALSLEKVALGKRLFSERLLSRDHSLSCADCHVPRHAFTDGKAKAVGVFGRQGDRNVPTLVNRVWGRSFFWDGRIPTLEEQVLQPIQSAKEMAIMHLTNRCASMGDAKEGWNLDKSHHDLFGIVQNNRIGRSFRRPRNMVELVSYARKHLRSLADTPCPCLHRFGWADLPAMVADAFQREQCPVRHARQ